MKNRDINCVGSQTSKSSKTTAGDDRNILRKTIKQPNDRQQSPGA